ncbi:MAG: YIP1 family protein [Bacteroidetes bacterium]|nr:YIP1 family protein [Bacteroidota bacterium]
MSNGDFTNFFQKMKGFLLEPSQTFNACKEESLHEAMKQYVYLLVIFSVIAASFIAPNLDKFGSFFGFEEFNIGLVIFFIIGILLASIIGSWIGGAIIHIGVYLFGGRKGIDQTLKAVIYSMYISILLIIIFGFLEEIPYIDKIPFIDDVSEIIVVIWPLALIIIGVRQLHEITTFRAATGVLFTQFLPLALVVLIMGFMPEEYTNYASNGDSILSIEPTSDNGYILAGSTTISETGVDSWLIKIDANGSEQWNKTFGGTGRDIAYSAIQTSDGCYLIIGETESYGIESDAWLIKIDVNGSEQWNKTFGGNNPDWIGMAQQTSDGGFVLTGYTESYGKSGDAWLIKTDVNGNQQWSKTFGGKDSDWVVSVKKTSDDGYILAGTTESFGAGKYDAWLIKTDANGNSQWERTFGGAEDDMISSFQKTSDGGFILTGDTVSYGGSYDPYNDCYWPKVWLIRTDSNGNLQWNRTFGRYTTNGGRSVQQTSDGGFILAGVGSYYDAGLIKTDANGNEQWNKTFGGDYWETAYSVQQTQDGGYIFVGSSLYFGSEGGAWLTKTDANGNLLWSKMFGDNYLNKSLEFKNI